MDFDSGFPRIKKEMTSLGDRTMAALDNVLVDQVRRAIRWFLQEEITNTPRKQRLTMIGELTRN